MLITVSINAQTIAVVASVATAVLLAIVGKMAVRGSPSVTGPKVAIAHGSQILIGRRPSGGIFPVTRGQG